jgi:transcriptional regulator with XRE-family HTH domain
VVEQTIGRATGRRGTIRFTPAEGKLRRRRIDAGLTQAALGGPFTRAFVSAVEHGLAMPSIPALALLTDRLDTPLHDFFKGVNDQMTGVYSDRHGTHEDPATRRRR